jgi:alpha-tubulin suppressor-like RCC1 family protein
MNIGVRAAIVAAGLIAGAPARATVAASNDDAVVDVVAGARMSCAARASGRVSCWGLDVLASVGDRSKTVGQRPFPVAGLDGITQVALGPQSLCAIDRGGRLRCLGMQLWQRSGSGYGDFRLEGFAQVAASSPYTIDGSHACAVKRDGTVLCWGSNVSGELGAGDLAVHKEPVTVAGIADAVEVTAGSGVSCARLRGGAVMCWGRRLGLRDPQGDPLRPRKVPGLDDAVSVSSGSKLTCAARGPGGHGEVLCWGHGAFGVPGRVQIDTPTPIPGVGDAVQVSVGATEMACARTAAGGVVCWGSGALGDGKLSEQAAPVALPGLRDVVQISVGTTSACARTRAGAALCWGRNDDGDSGHLPQLQPASRPLPDRPRAARIAASGDRTCLVAANGELRCRAPASAGGEPVKKLGPVAGIAVGLRHACLRRPDGHVLCWGENDNGQLGDGTTITRTEPAPTVPPIDDARAIVSGGMVTCALRATGELACWGQAYGAQGPVPTGGFRDAVEVAVGRDFICARRREGEVACFGGRFGKHAAGPEQALAHREQPPPTVAELSPARAIAAHDDQMCALRRDGGVVCTGGGRGNTGYWGEVSLKLDPKRALKGGADGVALAAGKAHACLLRRGGGVVCWGDGARGQLGGGSAAPVAVEPVAVAGVAGAQEIVAGDDQTCVRLKDGDVRCWGFDSDGRLTGAAGSLRPGRVDLP